MPKLHYFDHPGSVSQKHYNLNNTSNVGILNDNEENIETKIQVKHSNKILCEILLIFLTRASFSFLEGHIPGTFRVVRASLKYS